MSNGLKAGFDISKLKGTNLSAIKEQNDEIKTKSSKKRDYLSIEDGANKFRFFPAHPDSDEKGRYSQRKFVVWFQVTGRDKEGGEKLVNRSFLNAVTHAGQEKDLVEEYIKLATEQIKEDDTLDNKDKLQKLKDLTGFENGIKYQGKYLAYAIDTTKKEGEEGRRGLIELSNGIKKQLDKISLAEIEEEPDGADIISDPSEGVTITIKRDPKASNTERYSVSQGRKPVQITQGDADWWIEEDSLTDMLFKNVSYHKGTLEQLAEGIENYDEKHELGVASTDDFLEIYEELLAKLDDAPIYDGDDSAPASTPKKEGAKERAPRKVKKALGDMDKSELKEFIIEADLDIRVMRATTVEEILQSIEDETELTADNFPSDLGRPSPDLGDESDEEENDNALEDDKEEEAEEKPARASRRVRKERG